MMHTPEPWNDHPFLSTSISGLVIGQKYTVLKVAGESMCDYVYLREKGDRHRFDLRLFKIN